MLNSNKNVVNRNPSGFCQYVSIVLITLQIMAITSERTGRKYLSTLLIHCLLNGFSFDQESIDVLSLGEFSVFLHE